MKKSIHLVLEEQEAIDLIRILLDEDADEALEFLKKHFRGKARDLPESG
jgi:hypothetical protein